jgi:hypothetical protein
MIALSGQPADMLTPYLALQENRRANRLAALREQEFQQAQAELAREEERQARVRNALAQLASPELPEQQRQATTLRLYGDAPQVAAGVSAELTRAREYQRQRELEEARRHYLEADYVIRNPQYATDIFRRVAPDEYAQITQQLGREPTAEEVIRLAHQARAHYGPLAGIDPATIASNVPAAIQVYEYWSRLDPQRREEMLATMRAPVVRDVGGVPTQVLPGGALRPLSTLEQELEAAGRKESERTRAREGAKADVQALEELPRAQQQAQEMLRLLDQLEKHPGLSGAVGVRAGLEYLPSTKEADFVALHDQVTGRLFMQAFETLKGGGQITEKEGEKATAALSRLQNRRQSKAAYKQAIQEIRDVVRAGLERAEQRARVAGYGDRIRATAGAQGGPQPPASAPETTTVELPPVNARGWRLMVDAYGNRAYVSPDGTQYEEVP